MRKIIFRGKSADGEWHYGDLRQFGRQDKDLNGKVGIYHVDNDDWRGCPIVDESSVGQYTGLTDKNGTDIYEGDMLRDALHNHVVKFKNGIFLAEVEDEYGYDCIKPTMFKATEVIGNIHDNKIKEE